MTKEELAQRIKDSDYTCKGIYCTECISVNGFGCCLQDDKKLFVYMVLSKNKKKGDKSPEHIIAELEKENAKLKERFNKKFDDEWHLNDLYQRLKTDLANAQKCSGIYLAKYLEAKEIIKELLDFDFLPEVEIKKQAEQFIKDSEVEK